jgi:hypothetical protein
MYRKIENYLVGSDIEVFLIDELTGQVISAEGIISGTKEIPFPLGREGCAKQLDNISLEYNVPPTTDPAIMFENIQFVINTISEAIPQGIGIKALASAELDPKYLQTEQAQTMGCEASFNAWQRIQNPRPSLEENPNLRVCGGHIHIGYDNPDQNTSEAIIRAMDMFLGVPSVIFDKDKKRKQLYGKAGEFRFTSYGCEYRVLSNFWTVSQEMVDMIYQQIAKAISFVEENGCIDSESDLGKEIQSIINTGDESRAKAFIAQQGILEKELVYAH